MAELSIILDPNYDGNLIYYPGNVLKGVVELRLTTTQKIRGLSVIVYGRGKTYWSNDEIKRIQLQNGTFKEQYNGKEIFIDAIRYLLEQQQGLFFEMTPGVYKYNFALELPKHLPSTLNVLHGDISYNVGATLEISDLPDIKHMVPITIIRNDDMRLNQDLQIPFEIEYMHIACCWICKSLPLSTTISLPLTGFVNGEQIPIKINYVNKSSRDLSDTVIKLKRRIAFYSDTPKMKEKILEETMAKFTFAGVKPNSSKIIEENLIIPPNLLCSNEEYSRYIRISYYLSVVIELITAPTLYIPITIGPTPIVTGIQQNEGSNLVIQPIPSAPMEPPINDDLLPSFPEFINVNELDNCTLPQPSTSSDIGWNFKQ